MPLYELTNEQRKFFGLTPVTDNWDRVMLNDEVSVYFQKDRIVKILHYKWGYVEYDTDIDTRGRQVLLPKTAKGTEQKFTIPRLLKIKGNGIRFSGSFEGGGIHVYDNRRSLAFIKSYHEEGPINDYMDIDNWISKYIANLPADYFQWLSKELSKKRQKIKSTPGDIIAYKVSQQEYAFARILADVSAEIKKGPVTIPAFEWIHPRPLAVAPYSYYSDSPEIDIDRLSTSKTLPSLYIFDTEIYYGEMPIVGHSPLTEKDLPVSLPQRHSTSLTIPYSKTDIDKFIAANGG